MDRFLNVQSLSTTHAQIAVSEQSQLPVGLKYDPVKLATSIANCLEQYGFKDIAIINSNRKIDAMWCRG